MSNYRKRSKHVTASYNLITNILKNKLEFEGLIFTDGLSEGAANFKPSGELGGRK